jgi:hypothetical protein
MRAPLKPYLENAWSATFRILSRVPSSSALGTALFDLLGLVIGLF